MPSHKQVHIDRAAFTLTEVIMAMTVFGLVIAGVMSVFIGTLKSMRGSSDAIDLNSRSRFVQERLLYDLRAITTVTSMDSAMAASDVSKIFANYSNSEVNNCFRSFTAKLNEYNGGATEKSVTYSITSYTTPMGKSAKALVRTIDGKSQKVLTNLQDGCFTFYTRKKSTGTLTSLESTKAADVNSIRFAFLPLGRGPLVPGENDPSCSAVVQLRYPSYK